MSNQLRKGLIKRRTFLIKELAHSFIYKDKDKQKLFEMNFSQLENEYSYVHRKDKDSDKMIQ
ncbi:Fur-regulated basic protein FbpA [Halobacillus rhizosphaerae]|uniref:Fur-regulated basic protein FbpA n=1 Tax=Halobacillus rhizosphaerae TaxID=3064889 RepID=UPI00398A608B